VDGVVGSLNLYSHRPLEVTERKIRWAEEISSQIGAAIQSAEDYRSVARVASGLAEAMRSRGVIEQAKGMLMAERGVGATEAFGLLRDISQKSNVKLRDVARRIVEERSNAPAEEPAESDLPSVVA
jgi:hypothetical protein